MHICIYGHNLSVYTSGYPMRGLVLKLIQLRNKDRFTIVLPDETLRIKFGDYYYELNSLPNAKIVKILFNKRLSYLQLMLGYQNYAAFDLEADLYLTISADYFGYKNKPLINILADLSSIKLPLFSTLKWHGKIMVKSRLKFISKYSDHIACISEFTRNDLLELFPELGPKSSVIYNGIEEIWFNSAYDDININGIMDSDNGYWIWYGYISNRKNISNLLEAYSKLKKESKIDFLPKILLIGDISSDQKFIKTYIRNNLNDCVKFIPHQDILKLKYLVKKSRGLLFPSYYEGFGLPVIEAFSQGIPVLHSDTTALPEIAGGLGISCNPYSTESIMNGLKELLNINNSIEETNRRIKWSKQFTYKNAAEKLSNVIDKVSSQKGI